MRSSYFIVTIVFVSIFACIETRLRVSVPTQHFLVVDSILEFAEDANETEIVPIWVDSSQIETIKPDLGHLNQNVPFKEVQTHGEELIVQVDESYEKEGENYIVTSVGGLPVAFKGKVDQNAFNGVPMFRTNPETGEMTGYDILNTESEVNNAPSNPIAPIIIPPPEVTEEEQEKSKKYAYRIVRDKS